jgi:hypothetical protein
MGKKPSKPTGTPGRKPLPPDQKKSRTRPLYILCDDEERELIDAAAAIAELPASTWARDILLRAARRVK